MVRDDVLHMIATNVRHSRDFQGDLAAMIGSARVGERRVQDLLKEYGAEIALAGVEAVLDAAERQTRASIATWKDGVYRGEAVLDDDGHGYRDIHVRAKVTKRGSDLTVDLSGSDPQVVGFINSSYANMRSAVAMALAYLIDPETPKNDGTFRPLKVMAREGTVVWAKAPAPVTLCTNHCAQEIGEAMIKALAGRLPGPRNGRMGTAFSHRHPGPRLAQQAGPSSGTCFMRGREEAPLRRAMGGPRPASGRRPAASSSEVWRSWRSRFPLFFRRHEFRPDSEGDGQYRGGVGSVLELDGRNQGTCAREYGRRWNASWRVRYGRGPGRAAPSLPAALRTAGTGFSGRRKPVSRWRLATSF